MDPIARMVAAGAAGVSGGDPTYVDDVFSTTLYTGNSSGTGSGDEQVITTGIDNTEKSLIWFRNRSGSSDHKLFDTERTSPDYRWLRANKADAELQSAAVLKDRTTTGFTVVNATSGSGVAATNPSNSEKMVAWNFRAMPGFFDIVTYTGTGSAHSISHSLGSEPGMIFYKAIDDNREWMVYHRSLGASKGLILNENYSEFSTSDFGSGPTSTHFSVGNTAVNNTSGKNYVAYIFAHDDQSFGTNSDEAIIKCDSYSGASAHNIPLEVNVGFEPQWVLIKDTNSTRGWVILDTMRGWSGATESAASSRWFRADTDAAESGGTFGHITSTGFVVNNSSYVNGNWNTFIYMAIRRPHKPPTAGTDVFALDATSASGSTGNAFDAPFPVDMEWHQDWGSNIDKYVGARLTSGKYLRTNSTAGELSGSAMTFDSSDGVLTAFGTTDYSAQMFKRAPGFFDVVAYEGTGSARTVSHNLGAVPELVIVKNRDLDRNWGIWSSYLPAADNFLIFTTSSVLTDSSVFQTTSTFTSTQFGVGTNNTSNKSGDGYIGFLFASLDGISKIGTYSGTGSNINVDCGFTAGARFVLIKRTDAGNITTHWYMWDTAHGIVSGNDPYIRLNDANAQVTGTDYIDPLNAGFTVTSSAPTGLNANGGTYLFLAIA